MYATDVTLPLADQFVRIVLAEDVYVPATDHFHVGNGRNRAGGETIVAFVESPPAQAILARGMLPATEGA